MFGNPEIAATNARKKKAAFCVFFEVIYVAFYSWFTQYLNKVVPHN